MGAFVRVAALCWVAELALAKVVTVSEGLCSTNLPAPTYGWVSTSGTTIPYTFPPTSTQTSSASMSASVPQVPSDEPSISVPEVYPTASEPSVEPSISVPEVYPTASEPPVSISSVVVVPIPSPPPSDSPPIIDPIYTSTSTSSVPPVELPSVIPSSTESAVEPPITTAAPELEPVPSEDPTTTSTTSEFVYIPAVSSNPPIVAPPAATGDACVQTAPEGSTIQCDAADGLTYCYQGINYGLQCGVQYDLIPINEIFFTYTAEECLDQCVGRPGCAGVQWNFAFSDCTLFEGLYGVSAELSPYIWFLYNREFIEDTYLPQQICPFNGCTEQPLKRELDAGESLMK